MATVHILMLEDSPLDCDLETARLERNGIECAVRRVETREEFEEGIGAPELDLVLADYSLPDFDGVTALAIAMERKPDLPFLFVSGVMGEEVAIDCLHR